MSNTITPEQRRKLSEAIAKHGSHTNLKFLAPVCATDKPMVRYSVVRAIFLAPLLTIDQRDLLLYSISSSEQEAFQMTTPQERSRVSGNRKIIADKKEKEEKEKKKKEKGEAA